MVGAEKGLLVGAIADDKVHDGTRRLKGIAMLIMSIIHIRSTWHFTGHIIFQIVLSCKQGAKFNDILNSHTHLTGLHDHRDST